MEKDIASLQHTTWRCQYHVVFAPKYRRMAIYGQIKADIRVGRNKKQIAEYIKHQLDEDQIADQMSLKEFIDPFTGSKNAKA